MSMHACALWDMNTHVGVCKSENKLWGLFVFLLPCGS